LSVKTVTNWVVTVLIINSFFGVAGAQALRCESLFVSDALLNSMSENLARLNFALETNRDVYNDPVEKMRITQSIAEDLNILAQVDAIYVKKYLTALKALRTGSESEQQTSMKKEREKRLNEQKKDSRKLIKHAQQLAVFNKISAGRFMMGETGNQKETFLSQDFEMMQTPVTQMMWARLNAALGETDLAKLLPSKFIETPESQIGTFLGQEVRMALDNPVENVSWVEVKNFIDKLNHVSKNGDFETQQEIAKVISDHRPGDTYDLPTDAQWEFVMRNRGAMKHKFFDREDDKEILKYAWLYQNSEKRTHPVASLLPRLIDGKLFYDFEGNVYEWTKDAGSSQRELIGGIDPVALPNDNVNKSKIARGASWSILMQQASSSHRQSFLGTAKSWHIGFRMIRLMRK
jgi:formylglycine-generating enzyme required for sulfatase activity